MAQKNKSDCENENLSYQNSINLAEKTNFFQMYTENIPNEVDMAVAVKELNNMINGLTEEYKSNQQTHATFCRIKFENIENSAKNIQKILGARPK